MNQLLIAFFQNMSSQTFLGECSHYMHFTKINPILGHKIKNIGLILLRIGRRLVHTLFKKVLQQLKQSLLVFFENMSCQTFLGEVAYGILQQDF